MSIPKEPRQLMINLMYLVLTALLALNVSAEVMNAFFSLDKGIKQTSETVDRSNAATLKSINTQADAYKNAKTEGYKANAQKAIDLANGFNSYMQGVRDELWAKAGGDNPKVPGQPKDIRNKDLTTRWFITEGKGAEIEAKVVETRAAFLALVEPESRAALEASLPLLVEVMPPGVKAKNWPELKFKQMPVAAVVPILGKLQSDSKASATAILNDIAAKVGGTDIKFDEFEPVISAQKGYVIRGEKYIADVFLSARSSTANNVSISVNGSGMPVKEGKAHYEVTANDKGTKKFSVNISVKNPLTGEVKSYKKDFEYEVGERSCSVQLDKMNVFYIGVENPITVSAAGVSTNELKVSASGVNLAPSGSGKYVVTATSPGAASITLSGGGLPATKFDYRVKRIPDPVARLGAKYVSASLGSGEFKAQGGIAAVLDNFDFEAKCNIGGFNCTYLAKRQDPIIKSNGGARFGSEAQDLVNKAKPGDTYFFDDIKAKCPGDSGNRDLGTIVIKIK
jgi:gliding motility-associated protein GldM